jgi:DNA-binding NarL/FixJ family response regulator
VERDETSEDAVTRVFVVDDTPQMLRMLEQMLTLDEFEVVGLAASGETAVPGVDDTDPDVVVIDYKMPGLDGLATTRLIREHRPEQAIILYTAYLDDVLERDAEQAGVALCVEKIDGISALERDIRRLAGELF